MPRRLELRLGLSCDARIQDDSVRLADAETENAFIVALPINRQYWFIENHVSADVFRNELAVQCWTADQHPSCFALVVAADQAAFL